MRARVIGGTYLGDDVSSVSDEDGDGGRVARPGSEMERRVAAVIAKVHLEAVRLHVLGEPRHQIDLHDNGNNEMRKTRNEAWRANEATQRDDDALIHARSLNATSSMAARR